MNTSIEGNSWIYGDNIDTDVIIPARYLNTSDDKELASHCMEDIDISFAKNVKPGDVIVAGENFGCGSSREHAPLSIKACGVSIVIAKSFARIFFRNAINIGLPILEHPTFSDECEKGDKIFVDLDNGVIKNITKDRIYQCQSFPSEIQALINQGGLVNYTKNKLLK